MQPSKIAGYNKPDVVLGAYPEVQNCKGIQNGSQHNFQDLYIRDHKIPSNTLVNPNLSDAGIGWISNLIQPVHASFRPSSEKVFEK